MSGEEAAAHVGGGAPLGPGRAERPPMRVLHVMASGARGGGLDHLLGLLPALRDRGIRCRVAIGEDGPGLARLRDLGFEVDPVDLMGSRLDPFAPRRIGRLVERHGPDVVHAHGTRAAFFCALARTARRPPGPPHVYTAHGLSYAKKGGPLSRATYLAAERLVCRNVERVISVCAHDLRDLEGRGWVRPGAGHHIPNAVDTARFAPADAEGWLRARARMELSPDDLVVGTVARLVPQKAVGDLVDAVRAAPRWQLVVVGEGPERAALEARAATAAHRIRFLGARDDVAQLVPAFDVFALSSRWEGEPVALLEALACGVPCVATDTAGSREVLEGSGAGVLVPVGEPAALTAALVRLESADERARMAARAPAAVAGRTFEANAAAVEEVYRQLRPRGAL